MKSEDEIRKEYNSKLKHYRETDIGDKDFQHGYVFALQWVLGLHAEDDED